MKATLTPTLQNLHDAILVQVNFIWKTGIVELHLRTDADPEFILKITNVITFNATRGFEWGMSNQINTAEFSDGLVAIEMQSGDVVTIKGDLSTHEGLK